ncbi:hypothetical protein OX283_006740 [Flavobacterium sp. SUN052]|uniref:hypothetical protein n=1 Tax=Flavobacterium sp. SUN052 TaxID=3002441 RepID=UPI00237D5928|nr:hypothetical protein [Flavobacterium sp. SUN052]MEC4004346.1 hypothetical protein [Flavobacterium sp. SUN052]
MRKFIALAFLSIYLFSATELHQFLKLPVLVEHFSEHKQKDQSITLWKFLCMHYANGNVKDADYDKDSKLPFKTHDNCNSTNHVTILPEQRFCFNAILIPSEIPILNNHYPQFSNTTFLKSIWQPPKFS